MLPSQAISGLACERETNKDDFKKFMEWHASQGPFDILIDGANVAMFGQNQSGGGFRVAQIRKVRPASALRHDALF